MVAWLVGAFLVTTCAVNVVDTTKEKSGAGEEEEEDSAHRAGSFQFTGHISLDQVAVH